MLQTLINGTVHIGGAFFKPHMAAIVQSALDNLATGGGPFPVDAPVINNRYNVNLPVANPAGQIALAVLDSNYIVDLELSALQAEGQGEIISTPRVMTVHGPARAPGKGRPIPRPRARRRRRATRSRTMLRTLACPQRHGRRSCRPTTPITVTNSSPRCRSRRSG